MGSILSVWSLGGSVEEFLTKLGGEAFSIIPYIRNLIIILGIFTIGPLTLGFIIGFLIGLKG